MSTKVSICFFDNDNKPKNKEISIEKPNTYEDLIKILFEQDNIIFYESEGKEKKIQNNEEFQLSFQKLFIRPKTPQEKEEVGTILPKINNDIQKPIPKNTNENNNKINELEIEKRKQNEIENNKNYEAKIFDVFQKILNKMKEIDELINPNNNKIKQLNNILSTDYIQKNFVDISNIIYKEFEDIKQYIQNNSNNNSKKEDKSNKNEVKKSKWIAKLR